MKGVSGWCGGVVVWWFGVGGWGTGNLRAVRVELGAVGVEGFPQLLPTMHAHRLVSHIDPTSNTLMAPPCTHCTACSHRGSAKKRKAHPSVAGCTAGWRTSASCPSSMSSRKPVRSCKTPSRNRYAPAADPIHHPQSPTPHSFLFNPLLSLLHPPIHWSPACAIAQCCSSAIHPVIVIEDFAARRHVEVVLRFCGLRRRRSVPLLAPAADQAPM